MDREEEILGMMATAQKQQEAAEQAIESLNSSRSELNKSLANQQNELVKEHRELIKKYQQAFTAQGQTFSKSLYWLPIAGSVALTTIFCGAIIGVMFLYLDSVMNDIAGARSARDQLQAYNVNISTCKRQGETLPCVSVFTDKAYGGGDIFVLKPK